MPFRRFLDRRRRENLSHDLYVALVEQARRPVFYTRFGVPDTVDGRFDMVVLHAFLLMRRLGEVEGARAGEARALSQAVFDLMFADMDQNLREMGVTDMSVGAKVKRMAEAFYGRVAAYDAAMGEDDAALSRAVARNLYRESPPSADMPARMAAYLRRQAAHLAALPADGVLEGRVAFAPEEIA
ncbi:MAG: ubiquinol-cytochrome C chaperone family protein [Magnetospirillum sp.]|nr:ubiquinol-cytochrome C chaperone family protein [Magnetospirillum sp.]